MARPVVEEYSNELITHLADRIMVDFIDKLLPAPNRKKPKIYDSLASKYAVELRFNTTPTEVEIDGKTFQIHRTALSLIRLLKKELLKRLKPEDFNKQDITSLKIAINTFNYRLNQSFRQDYSIRNMDYRRRVEKRNNNKITVNFTSWLDKVEALFKQLELYLNGEEGVNRPDWRDVSIAIALCTGRRQSEVHSSGVFTVIDEYEMSFTGQLKGKGRTVDDKKLIDAEFKIPTICPARYIVMGIQFLEMEGKRTDIENDGVMVVNKRWGKPLSQRIKSDWMIISNEEFLRADPEDNKGMTYHKTRSCYLVLAIPNLTTSDKMSALELGRYVECILGDKDMAAIKNYERFSLVEGSRTRI